MFLVAASQVCSHSTVTSDREDPDAQSRVE